jgi:two-component system CheB/CheR fusion protein
MTPDTNSEFEALLNYIKRSRGFDFTGYKRSTLMRRVQKRMQAVGIETISGYMDYLEVDPQEFIQLFNTILINVTSFFRDQSPWDYLQTEVIPLIVARKEPHEPIRVWSAGCASGQEAYTLALTLAEALGVEQFSERVKIYATDIDDEALNQARGGSYNAKEVENIPQDLLERYFDCNNSHYTFRQDLRRAVIFGRHNLVQDAPISRIDLLVCRNTLMYFNAEAQAKIIARFHFALNESGVLVLGKAEMLLSHSKSFTPIDLNRRIFTKVANVSMRDRVLLINNNDDKESNYISTDVRLRDTAFDVSTLAQMVVDVKGILVLVNDRMRSLFALSPRDVNRPLQNLEISYRPVELRSSISQANNERRTIVHKDVEWTNSNSEQYFDVQVTPLFDFNGNLLGSSISFNDVTRSKKLTEELEYSSQELEMAYEELQSTSEELETTNEELQSTNEELETTNEELQSTNEELETMNEELQSSNQELQTINNELRQRSLQLNEVNAFLEAILTSIRGAVVVVDRELQVVVWNNKAEDLWGWRSEEIQGQHFLNLDIGLPVEQLLQALRTCLLGAKYQEMTLKATNRRGKAINCQVACTPLITATTEIRGVLMLMEKVAEVENVNKL